MSQTTFSDDELFGEAAAEMRDDVEGHLAAARAELPEADEVWETEADNVLGVLNALRSALDVGEAEEHLRQAKKWYTMGERADAFDDAADLAAAIEDLEGLIETIRATHDDVSDLTNAVPELRGSLQDLDADGGED
ncbi:hypothetical protein EI982_13615 [Haloplanus rallus]|uniref:Uncharacterized protein n=1 Tax=Haloplanus rallus TaxID=1816183 RepID=A0A6B9FF83_9EURY|nr:DUF5790 family protein [Haloplanus rallus]QGX95750.1 hypothetical protein EI982_13615 [Haloplanus rallus]